MAATLASVAAASVGTPLRMLAFGDSLTAGWTSFSSGATSGYVSVLQRELAEAHKIKADIAQVGHAGLPASGALHSLKSALQAHHGIDICLIWLGANDMLGGGGAALQSPHDATINHLRELHSECRSSGATTVALGMLYHPAIVNAAAGSSGLSAFNHRIRSEVGADHFFDVQAYISPSHAKSWSSDQVHLSKSGYADFGRELAPHLAEFLCRGSKNQSLRDKAVSSGRSSGACQ